MFDDDVWRYFPLGPPMTVAVGVIGLGLLLAVSLRSGPGARRVAAVVLGMTVLATLAVTLGDGSTGLGRSVSLRPGEGIRAELANVNAALGVINVAGNVVIFVPLGWIAAVLVMYPAPVRALHGMGRGALTGLGLSLAIEVLQYFVGRAADVDDVLLNTTGAVLGASVGSTLSVARRRLETARQPQGTLRTWSR